MNYGSTPITLGGTKEYQDVMNGITFCTIIQLFEIHHGLSSILSMISNDNQNYDSEIPLMNIDSKSDISIALHKKEKELISFLRYADLGRFIDRLEAMKVIKQQVDQRRESIYNTELRIIEDVLTNEITFSFYVNLIKSEYIDYIDEDKYFLGDERDTEYKDTTEYQVIRPADFLRIILKSDREIKETFLGWISDIIKYQQQVEEHANEFYDNIKKWKSIE